MALLMSYPWGLLLPPSPKEIGTSQNTYSRTYVNNALASLTEAGLLLVCNLVSRAKRKGSLA